MSALRVRDRVKNVKGERYIVVSISPRFVDVVPITDKDAKPISYAPSKLTLIARQV
jgi:hypothetical protein